MFMLRYENKYSTAGERENPRAQAMRLDIIIPTYNRQELLQRTLKSLLVASVPSGLETQIIVVDNNSKDHTRQIVEDWMGKFNGRLRYLFEGQQGRSHA